MELYLYFNKFRKFKSNDKYIFLKKEKRKKKKKGQSLHGLLTRGNDEE